MNPSERSMQMRYASHISWANTTDRSARTEAARRASHHTRFVTQAREMHPNATDEQIAKVADSLRKAHYTELARRSAQARRIKGQQARAAKQRRVEAELNAAKSGKPAA